MEYDVEELKNLPLSKTPALKLLLQILGIRDDDTMALWGMSCDVYGQYLMGQRSYEKARDQFKKAYDISCEVSGETDEQSLVLLNSLGNDLNFTSSNQALLW